MERIFTNEVAVHAGERVAVAGWLHALRNLGGISFVLLRDARGIVQVVMDKAEEMGALEGLLPETVLRVEGDAVAEAQAPGGAGESSAQRGAGLMLPAGILLALGAAGGIALVVVKRRS